MSTDSRYVDRLPSCYARDPESNNAKMLSIGMQAIDEAYLDLEDTEEMVDLNIAYGKTLDLYGQMVEQGRGALDDTQYRYLIRNRIVRNFVRGDYESVVHCITDMFEVTPEDITIGDDPELSGVARITRLPFSVLQRAGLTASQAIEMIEQLLAVGVRVEADNFEGTFEFSDANEEYDEDTGFSDNIDPDLQSMGGYLGFAPGEDEDTPLPIV
ncbi:DUF2612 domain-containing protein [Ruminococcaceae bacterium OttesenSCG-928-I18]|nr:DUF2612 domain-containing protein [Ruminococcaceae bacterium OttesenSCG-928-I18]